MNSIVDILGTVLNKLKVEFYGKSWSKSCTNEPLILLEKGIIIYEVLISEKGIWIILELFYCSGNLKIFYN